MPLLQSKFFDILEAEGYSLLGRFLGYDILLDKKVYNFRHFARIQNLQKVNLVRTDFCKLLLFRFGGYIATLMRV